MLAYMGQQNTAYSEQFDLPPIASSTRKLRSCAKDTVPFYEQLLTFASIAVCGAALWFLASQSADMDGINHKISLLESQIQQVQADNTSLAAQLDTMTRPTNVLSIAMSKLHMHFTKPVTIDTTISTLTGP